LAERVEGLHKILYQIMRQHSWAILKDTEHGTLNIEQ